VVPDIVSRRKHSVNPDNLTPINKDLYIRNVQEVAKDDYEKIKQVNGGIFKRHPSVGMSNINPQTEEERKH
jgi:hypothetical protein